jgi:photosystem II stability/assembly factor-like uncharacterized protein
MRTRRVILLLVAMSALALSLPAAAQNVKIDSETFEGLTARALGPAAMSGRITAIDAYPGDRLTIYVGSASGGVWKSTNGGISFKAVFDKQTQSIGAVAIDASNPKTVWVGTGESCVRNSVSVGDGVYKTTDGGGTWQRMGLEDSERIPRIIVHPREPNTVYVCALGHLWNANAERGVFRTTDGGKKWEKVLFVNEDTGCSDIAIDPQDPSILYAGMWQVRRKPWTFTSGGPGSGLYKSTDGGTKWTKIQKGLAEGDLGRIAIGVAASRPSVVYAVVEAKKTALYRSDDLGESWREVNSSGNIQARPFYFAHLAVDPKDFNRVYKPGGTLTASDDGGKTFGPTSVSTGAMGGAVHPDHHALWINPKDTNNLILGTDGGVYISYDRGAQWRLVGALPVSQFYHVSYDLDRPYNVYGGLQDNGTWMGPSQRGGGISNRHWWPIGGGDGFWALVDPTEPDFVYVEMQGGYLWRVRRSTGETKTVYPYAGTGEPELRFNWNTPIHLSPTQKGTLYIGAQFLYRSRDRGESWERISPDLTTNNPEKQKQEESGGLTIDNSDAERHCTIYAISESPKNPAVIWAGTDDGNLQVTRDGGKTWANVVANVPGLPANTWVSYVEAGHYDEATAYVTFDGHMLGDMKTYVYRTQDFGKTWQALATADVRGYAHVVREDTVNANLLFLGTEFGLYASLDGGASWGKFSSSLPPVAVHDIVIHPREADLLIATHGRGIYIVDDITPLRKLTPELLNAEVAFLESRPSEMKIPAGEQRFDGDTEFTAYSPENTAWITYYLKKRHIFGDLRIEIYDAKGALMYSVPGGRRRGLNRVEWPMRLKGPRTPRAASLGGGLYTMVGPLVPEGTYTVKMIKGKDTYTSEVRLVPDPRSTHSAEDRELGRRTAHELYQMIERLAYVADAYTNLRDQANDRAGKLAKNDPLRPRVEALGESLEKTRRTLVTTKEGQLTGEIRLREKILSLYGSVNGYFGRPTETQRQQVGVLGKRLDEAAAQLEGIAAKELPAINSALGQKKLQPLASLTQEEWKKKQEESQKR